LFDLFCGDIVVFIIEEEYVEKGYFHKEEKL
jgi:hypothetical protein